MPPRPDVDQIRKAWALKREGGMSQQKMAEALGIDPRTISNYFSPPWLAQRKLGHLRFAGQEPQIPRSTLENKAWAMCESGDHSWMKEDLYKGHAYTESESTDGLDGLNSSSLKTFYTEKGCHFCGLVTRRRKGGLIVI